MNADKSIVILFFFYFLKVLSEQVANGLERVGGEEVTETVRFVRMIDKFFDCLNVSNISSGKHSRKAFQDPYRRSPKGVGTDDFRLKVCSTCVYIDLCFNVHTKCCIYYN